MQCFMKDLFLSTILEVQTYILIIRIAYYSIYTLLGHRNPQELDSKIRIRCTSHYKPGAKNTQSDPPPCHSMYYMYIYKVLKETGL